MMPARARVARRFSAAVSVLTTAFKSTPNYQLPTPKARRESIALGRWELRIGSFSYFFVFLYASRSFSAMS
jgi:hypothetical protein